MTPRRSANRSPGAAQSGIYRISRRRKDHTEYRAKTNGAMKADLPRFGGSKYGESGKEEHRTKGGAVYVPTLRRNKRDVWTVSTAGFKGAHFATFPEKLVEPCILAGCPEGGVVLDPFSGSGTTGAVAVKKNRRYIGIEINPEYAELSRNRIAAIEEQGIQLKIR